MWYRGNLTSHCLLSYFRDIFTYRAVDVSPIDLGIAMLF